MSRLRLYKMRVLKYYVENKAQTTLWDDNLSVPWTKMNYVSKIWPMQFRSWHYNNGIMSAMASQITSLTMFTQAFIQAQIKKKLKAPRHWPLWGEFTSNGENAFVWWHHHDGSLQPMVARQWHQCDWPRITSVLKYSCLVTKSNQVWVG